MIFRKILALDLGTSLTRVILPTTGIVYEEPSIIAYDKKLKKIIHIGNAAQELIGKTPEEIEIIHPIKNSVISHYRSTESMIRFLINSYVGRFSLVKPHVIVAIPSSITSVERRALEEAVLSAGAGEVFLYSSSFLSSIGAGQEIDKPYGNMIVNMGAGSTESAVLSFNGIVVSNSSKQASNSFNESIINYFKKVYGLVIGENMAEKVKLNICSAVIVEKQNELEVRGRDASNGMPKSVKVRTNDMHEAVKPVLSQIIVSIRSVLEKTPPELSSDVVDSGILLAGGGVLFENISELFTKALGIPAVICEDPIHATANGLYKVMSNFDNYAEKGRTR